MDGPASGAWQMAVDEVLLESAAQRQVATLRFYQWSEPTLSLGYFQRVAERTVHPASAGCAVVRRQTGGGAILHDRELTYSLTIPKQHPLARQTRGLYNAVHDALVRVLHACAISAQRQPERVRHPAQPEPWLCFLRRSPGDILVGDAKICGSAQRRRSGAVLQHGSLLLEQSRFAPELPGLLELAGRPLAQASLATDWSREISHNLGFSLMVGELSPAEREAAGRLVREKYAHALWTGRR
jgi:lipoate-protein ligase A